MTDDDFRVESPAEIAELFLRTTREQMRAAESAEWSVVFDLANFRETLVSKMADAVTGPLSEHDRRELASVIVEVQNLDAEIARRAQHEASRLLDELTSTERGLAVAHGYGWTAAARPESLIDRYG